MPENKRTIYSRVVSKSRNSTGLPGVTAWYNDFKALIRYKGKTHTIGIYASAVEAHKAYMRTAKALGLKIRVRK